MADQSHVEKKDPSATLLLEQRRSVFDALCKDLGVDSWLSASLTSNPRCIDYVKPPPHVTLVEVVGGDMIRKRDDGICRIYFGRGMQTENIRGELKANKDTKFIVEEGVEVGCGQWRASTRNNDKKLWSWYFLESWLSNVSSTNIRTLLKKSESRDDFINAAANEQMLTNGAAGLYWDFLRAKQ